MIFFLKNLLLLTLNVFTFLKSETNNANIVFDLPDLTIDYSPRTSEKIKLEAFKTSINDKILESNDSVNYGRLNWVSVGYPTLVEYKTTGYRFYPRSEGFEIRLEFLTEELKNIFVETVERKYKIRIIPEQIVTLKPDKFVCLAKIYDIDNDIEYEFDGKAFEMTRFPLRVFFKLPPGAKKLFENISKSNLFDLISIKCNLHSFGKSIKQNILTINLKEIQDLNLIDEIFGPSDQVYVTRSQV
ncbi:unnamed protein product, partial [Brachionus calyciflorus]